MLLKTAPIPDVFTHVRLEGPSFNKHTTFLGAAFSITKNLYPVFLCLTPVRTGPALIMLICSVSSY